MHTMKEVGFMEKLKRILIPLTANVKIYALSALVGIGLAFYSTHVIVFIKNITASVEAQNMDAFMAWIVGLGVLIAGGTLLNVISSVFVHPKIFYWS